MATKRSKDQKYRIAGISMIILFAIALVATLFVIFL